MGRVGTCETGKRFRTPFLVCEDCSLVGLVRLYLHSSSMVAECPGCKSISAHCATHGATVGSAHPKITAVRHSHTHTPDTALAPHQHTTSLHASAFPSCIDETSGILNLTEQIVQPLDGAMREATITRDAAHRWAPHAPASLHPGLELRQAVQSRVARQLRQLAPHACNHRDGSGCGGTLTHAPSSCLPPSNPSVAVTVAPPPARAHWK